MKKTFDAFNSMEKYWKISISNPVKYNRYRKDNDAEYFEWSSSFDITLEMFRNKESRIELLITSIINNLIFLISHFSNAILKTNENSHTIYFCLSLLFNFHAQYQLQFSSFILEYINKIVNNIILSMI